jgi:two-component system, chemotaxis family, protein-glutamate methylesterase/glutaminase
MKAIAIGASAGGIEALGVLLPALPRTLRAAVFVVVHVPPGRPSLLAEIFAPRCALPVREAVDKEAIEPGTIWFAPPDYHLLVDGGPPAAQIALSADEPVNWSRPSIDVLFESAADLYGEMLAAVVLSGASDDGARGLAAVQRAGGLALVQDPADAAAAAMPRAALEHCPRAEVLALPALAARLAALATESAP